MKRAAWACAVACLVVGTGARGAHAQAPVVLPPTETEPFAFSDAGGRPVVSVAFRAATLLEVGTCNLPGASSVAPSGVAVRRRGRTHALAERGWGEEGCPLGAYLGVNLDPGEYEIVVSCARSPCVGQLAYRVHGEGEWDTVHEPAPVPGGVQPYPYVEAVARGFVAVNAAGGGAVLSGMAYYQFEVPLFVRIGGQGALTGGERGPIHRGSGWGMVGFDYGFGFAVALGFGVASVSPRPVDDPTVNESPIVVGAVRVGSADDTRLWLQVQGWDAGVEIGVASVQADLAIRVAPDLELGLEGAGGFDGVGFGEAYARARFGVLSVRVGAGVAGAFAQRLCGSAACPEVVHHVGPSFALGLGLRGW